MTAIAIDGPAGAGKSTVARALARALGFRYVDTGAMYRAVALAAIEAGLDPSDVAALQALAESLDLDADADGVMLEGRDVTDRIRAADVTARVSEVAAHAPVRAALVALQRAAARAGDVVMEGRDIGSSVLPDADVKVYLTATLGERAGRRARELGIDDPAARGELERTIAARDHVDSTRDASPLTKDPAAVEVDTTGKSIPEVVGELERLVREKVR